MFGGAVDHIPFQEPVFATYEVEIRTLKIPICAKLGRKLPSHSDC